MFHQKWMDSGIPSDASGSPERAVHQKDDGFVRIRLFEDAAKPVDLRIGDVDLSSVECFITEEDNHGAMFKLDRVMQWSEPLAVSLGKAIVVGIPSPRDDVVVPRGRPEIGIKFIDDPQEVIDFTVVVVEIPLVSLDEITHAEDGVGSEKAEVLDRSFQMD
jgi:hypothetical protein